MAKDSMPSGKTSRAGLPEHVITKDWGKAPTYGDSTYNDTMEGIDESNRKSIATAKKHASNKR